MDGGAKSFLAAVNAILLGQNETLFLGLDPSGHLHGTTNYSQSEPLVWHFLAVPQVWSIELALLFCAVAPWLVRRSALVILGVLAASLVVRVVCYAGFHLNFDPWTYRFFPNELALFLLGAVGYKIYRAPWRARAAEGLWIWALFALVLTLTVAFPFIPGRGSLKAWPYFALTTVTLPFLFAETKNWRWDRWLGELSYPIYLIHFLIIWICQAALPPAWQDNRSLWAMLGSLAASIILVQIALQPFENWRASRVRHLGK
jgi:peptidoglycan/LPS O-acetylase OafA/YrhL